MVQAISLAIVDKLGVFFSALCVIHCLAVPFLLPFMPITGIVTDEAFHPVLALIITLLAVQAFGRGYQRHQRKDIVALGCSGVLLVVVAMFIPEFVFLRIESEALFTSVGGAMLIVAHLTNVRSCRCRPLSGTIDPNCHRSQQLKA